MRHSPTDIAVIKLENSHVAPMEGFSGADRRS